MAETMNKIDKLINELCPGGVEFKELWEVTTWDKRFNAVDNYKQKKVIKYHYLLANQLKSLQSEGGNIKLLTTNNSDLWTTEELAGNKISEGEIVAIPGGGTANVQYYKGKFLTTDNRIAISIDKNILNNKYLYYFMLNKTNELQSFYRGSGIQHPSMAKVLDLKIPLPPLPIQEEIVKILDSFTELEAELDAELDARNEQYEYYRDELLTFGDDVEFKELEKFCINIFSGKNRIRDKSGKYPIYGSTGIIGQTNQHVYDKQQILVARVGANAGLVHIGYGKYDVSDNTLIIQIKDIINMKFLYYLLINMNLNQYAKGAGQPLITAGQLKSIKIPNISLPEQERIVAILDKFDALVNDISIGLPAELEARREQYEYYRKKLLTFKEVETND
jgi:type I restriction enzyme, S subunit